MPETTPSAVTCSRTVRVNYILDPVDSTIFHFARRSSQFSNTKLVVVSCSFSL